MARITPEGARELALALPEAVERIGAIAGSDRYVPTFLDLQTALDNTRQQQSYNTPSV